MIFSATSVRKQWSWLFSHLCQCTVHAVISLCSMHFLCATTYPCCSALLCCSFSIWNITHLGCVCYSYVTWASWFIHIICACTVDDFFCNFGPETMVMALLASMSMYCACSNQLMLYALLVCHYVSMLFRFAVLFILNLDHNPSRMCLLLIWMYPPSPPYRSRRRSYSRNSPCRAVLKCRKCWNFEHVYTEFSMSKKKKNSLWRA